MNRTCKLEEHGKFVELYGAFSLLELYDIAAIVQDARITPRFEMRGVHAGNLLPITLEHYRSAFEISARLSNPDTTKAWWLISLPKDDRTLAWLTALQLTMGIKT